jgi:hypothetical protein
MGPLGGPPHKGQKYHGQTQPQCQLAPNDATLLNSERNPKKKHNLRPSEQMEVGFDADWGFMLVEIDHDQLYFKTISRTGFTIDSGVSQRQKVSAADNSQK